MIHPAGFVARALFCFLAVAVTWNPSGISFVGWVGGGAAPLPEAAAAGAVLFAVHLLLARIAYLSLGLAGIAAVLATLLAGGLSLAEAGLTPWRPALAAYLPLVGIAGVLTAGLTWSIVKRATIGQSNVINPPP